MLDFSKFIVKEGGTKWKEREKLTMAGVRKKRRRRRRRKRRKHRHV